MTFRGHAVGVIPDEAGVGTRTTHIVGDDVRPLEKTCDADRCSDAACRAGKHRVNRLSRHCGRTPRAAIRAHDAKRSVDILISQATRQTVEILRDLRSDISVERGRRKTLEFPILRQNVGGYGNRDARHCLADDICRAALVFRIGV